MEGMVLALAFLRVRCVVVVLRRERGMGVRVVAGWVNASKRIEILDIDDNSPTHIRNYIHEKDSLDACHVFARHIY